jgi:hypothetical protein
MRSTCCGNRGHEVKAVSRMVIDMSIRRIRYNGGVLRIAITSKGAFGCGKKMAIF